MMSWVAIKVRAIISSISARKILDSRANPTVEVDVVAEDEVGTKVGFGRAAAPSGASKGRHEVTALPKGGVDGAVEGVKRVVAPRLVGMEVTDQKRIDALLRKLDGTPDLSRIGGNAAVAVSMAVAKAASAALNLPLYKYLGGEQATKLPYPLGNVLGGGAHAGRMAPDIQEFLVIPTDAGRFVDAAFANSQVHRRVRALIEAKDGTFTGGKGDEGAWAPNLGNVEALELVARACEEISEEMGFKIRPGLDFAASGLYDSGKKKYVYKREGAARDTGEQIDFVLELIETYEPFYVEDPLREDDFESFAEITKKAKRCLICGDDLFVTNVARIRKGIKLGAANAVLIKPNQIGTLSDTHVAVQLARQHGYVPVMSHRSGETSDETIAHLAVGFECPIIKTGVVGGERVAKLNELIRIEEELGEQARMGELPWK
ncbi:MAG: phosphopyruvate hydratase [Candidatus Hodarchaeaceae archaeon]|nr:phosphopyruvate hydratase [Candidatus Hodarchaeaceae archaeon]